MTDSGCSQSACSERRTFLQMQIRALLSQEGGREAGSGRLGARTTDAHDELAGLSEYEPR